MTENMLLIFIRFDWEEGKGTDNYETYDRWSATENTHRVTVFNFVAQVSKYLANYSVGETTY